MYFITVIIVKLDRQRVGGRSHEAQLEQLGKGDRPHKEENCDPVMVKGLHFSSQSSG